MSSPFSKLVVAVFLPLSLAGCNATTGALTSAGPAHIAKVEVSLSPNVGSPRFAEMVDGRIRGQATRFRQEGAARHVRVAVTEVHYKSAAQSLLIGDGNYASAEVTVFDPASGRSQAPVKAEAIEGAAFNGISGAIIARMQDRQKVDERLADRLAWNVIVKLYGQSAANEARDRPAPVAPASDPVKPGAEPSPVPGPKRGGTPVAAATTSPDARTTMASAR